MSRHVTVSGVSLEIEEKGQGRPILFLHPGRGSAARTVPGWMRWRETIASSRRTIPASAVRRCRTGSARSMTSPTSISIWRRSLQLENAVLAGNCFGGWMAAEMAVRNTARFAGLLLAAPLGIKVGGVLDRDITDMHAISRAEFMRLAWADPDKGAIDYTKLPDTELAGIARGRESLAVFGWKPYMHNPRLKRWLHRIDIPTHLLWGEQDGIVSTAYGEAWKAEIPGATMETIPQRRPLSALGTARRISPSRVRSAFTEPASSGSNDNAHLVLLRNGLPPGVGQRSGPRLAAGEFPQ